jgi:hypothetical protein
MHILDWDWILILYWSGLLSIIVAVPVLLVIWIYLLDRKRKRRAGQGKPLG